MMKAPMTQYTERLLMLVVPPDWDESMFQPVFMCFISHPLYF
jgi:hypothetical protein